VAGVLSSKEVFAGVFSRHAQAYRDRVMGITDPSEHRGRFHVVEALGARPGDRVLDLACGPGTLTLPLADAVGPAGRVVAVDLADGMLDLLREAAPAQVEVLKMDIEELEFPDAAFDAVACGHGLQFCPNLLRALWQARRVLRDGGMFAASLPARSHGREAARLMEEALAGIPTPPATPDRTATIECLMDPVRARGALVAAGFREPQVLRFEETIHYESPEDLVAKSCGWWACAWRLEVLDVPERERVQRQAVEVVRAQVGKGRIELAGSTQVLIARR
jgi:ubiquinone/menaquinone biosynthesis C-methylase UbiE